MGSFWEDDGEESVTIGYYGVKGNYCIVNKLKILKQVVSAIGYFNCEEGDTNGKRIETQKTLKNQRLIKA